jgi:predicted DNA-binding transcriptional regulator AlpA
MSYRILRSKEVRHLFGDISNSTLYLWVAQGKLPAPTKIVEGGRASGWPECVIEDLLKKRSLAANDLSAR